MRHLDTPDSFGRFYADSIILCACTIDPDRVFGIRICWTLSALPFGVVSAKDPERS